MGNYNNRVTKILFAVFIFGASCDVDAQTNKFPPDGNVGIGTINPLSALDVNGNIQISNSTVPMGIMTENTGTPFPLINLSLNYREPNKNLNYSGGSIRIDNRPGVPMFQWNSRLAGTNEDNNIMALTKNGHLGIGTLDPKEVLSVNGNIQISNSIVPMGIMTENTGTSSPIINLSLNFREINKNINYSGGAIRIDNRPEAPMFQWISRLAGTNEDHVVMALTKNGYLGIGTLDPKESLSVNGNIRSKQVKVETDNWPDYVFKKDYPLPSLNSVKIFIGKHQHLPEVPSEQEIVKNGLNLGEINKIILKKIEELTLYLIEKDQKEIDQEKTIANQNARIKKIEQQLNALLKNN
jgi:hypothetical protein